MQWDFKKIVGEYVVGGSPLYFYFNEISTSAASSLDSWTVSVWLKMDALTGK